jgi:hypothetical protein
VASRSRVRPRRPCAPTSRELAAPALTKPLGAILPWERGDKVGERIRLGGERECARVSGDER